ncbi:peptidase M60-like family-domain-containing protein [Aspergillus transmontanensis]|uniref:Peptidase M60-like family-domain-containing protein n=1 Tax=Aspergillus transmontanensis TaxID=1034304 RepID=A0A5N6VDH2_9EURO|nr:peptidase M60-like family-domain-containing protein [Aspergillus transmontanensis]
MRVFCSLFLAIQIGKGLASLQATPPTAEPLNPSSIIDEVELSCATEPLAGNDNELLLGGDGIHHRSTTTDENRQLILHAQPSSEPGFLPEQSGSEAKTALTLEQPYGKKWWTGQWQMASLKVRHNGPGKVDKVILESPDLRALNVSIFTVWPRNACPGTQSGSTRVHCEWKNIDVGSSRFTDIKFRLEGYDPADNPGINIPFTLTTYKGKTVIEQTKKMGHWERRAALRYKQTDVSFFKQPRAIRLEGWPDAESERRRLRQAFKFADFQSTGFYLNPATPLKVHVAGVQSGGPKPQLLVGTPALVHPTIDSERIPKSLEPHLPMNNGEHTVSSEYGGIMYIRYTGPDPNSLPAITVTLGEGDAAQPIPFFREGITTDDEWKTMLNYTRVPFAEHSGRRVRITGLAEDAKVWADRGQKQATLFTIYREILDAQDRISALDAYSKNETDQPSVLGNIVVQDMKNVNPTATHYRAAIPRQRHDEIWAEDRLRQSWMQWHEFGHQRQQTAVWSWRAVTELTVNIYSLAALRRSDPYGERPVREWELAKRWLAKPASEKDFDGLTGNGYYIGLVMFEQLRLAFGGDAFYRRLHFDARRLPEAGSNEDRKHNFMTLAAEVAQTDLTDYFTKWGLKPEARTIRKMQKQLKPKEDYTKKPVYGSR